MILKRILFILLFLSLPVFVFPQSWGHGAGLTSDQVQTTIGWKRDGLILVPDSPDYVVAIESGTISNPSLTFRTDKDTGIFLQAGGTLGLISDGVESARFEGMASGVNCFLFTPSIAGALPVISVAGTDTDIGIRLAVKGDQVVEISSKIKITGGAPGLNKVLTSDADGLATWTLPAGGGFTDAGATIILTNINDSVGIGESGPDSKFHVTDGGSAGTVTATPNTIATFESPGNGYLAILTPNSNERGIFFGEPASSIAGGIIYNNSGTPDGFQFRTVNNVVRMVIEGSGGNVGIATESPNAQLEVVGTPGTTIGGFASGQFHVTSPATTVNSNSAITGHSFFNGNTQLWYFGSTSSSNNNIALINRQNAELHLHTNNVNRFTIQAGGNVGIGVTDPDAKLEINGQIKITGGNPGDNKALRSDVNGLAVWGAVGHIVVQESFVSTNVRYFGELGLPGSQTGWTETGTGIISLFSDNVFGITKDVVKHFSTTGNTTKSESPITGADWDNILAFGASFSGITRITEDISTNSIFAGVGFAPANDPRASSIESRSGMFISVDATYTTIRLDGSTIVILDGTGGNPLVLKDEWFKWEAFINSTPDAGANFGAVDVYVNDVLIVTGAIISSNNAVSDEASLANSSSSGQTTFYIDNFGITIYEESATKTLSTALMEADVAQITVPEGRRNYTIIFPDGNPRAIGSLLRVVVNNLFGKITLKNETPAAPEALFNGLAEFNFDVLVKEIVGGVNTVDQANVYIGFKGAAVHIGGNFTDTNDQTITIVDTFQDVIFNQNRLISGITHTTGSATFTIVTGGVYNLEIAPQVGQGSGAANVEFQLIKNGTPIVDSGIQFSVGANSQTLPYLRWKEQFIATDTFEIQWASDSANTLLDNITSLFGGANIPSIMLGITQVGS